MIGTRNPVDNKLVKRFRELSDRDIERALRRAESAFEIWKKSAFSVRGKAMKNAATILRDKQEDYAKLMVLEMGKPLKEARSEIEKCAWVCDYYADNAKHFLKDDIIKTDASNSYVSYEPLGIVLAIMPWNFPFWQVFRFAAPNLMAGNIGLLKHASNVPQCSLAIQEIFELAQFPEGTFQALLIGTTKVNRLIKDERIKAVTLTGSEGAGKKVGETAGRNIKKSVLELGGSDPFIVLDDANLKEAAETAVKSRLINTGQSCIAAKRFIVMNTNVEPFVNLVTERMKALKMGDPMEEDTDLGPLAREDLAKTVMKQVKGSIRKGATVVLGANRPKQKGAYMNPTILKDVTPEMPTFYEEVFGPVMSIISVKSEEEAIHLANNSRYGLGASLWTEDKERAVKLARQIQAGNVFINSLVKSDPRLPFGGIKHSGYGRELSQHGIREFVNIKTVYIS